MALTTSRWIAAVALICTLMAAATLAADPVEPRPGMSATDVSELDLQLQRRLVTASRRWEALVRRDTVLARLERRPGSPAGQPVVMVDPLLPAAHRSVIERAVARQWNSLRVGSARIPVAIAVVIDTMPNGELPAGGRGQIAYEYVLPTNSDASPRCVTIVALQSRHIVRPGTQRALAELAATSRSASSLLGPCAFFARFGVPGTGIDRWLRSRGYDLVASPQWWSLGADDALPPGQRWQQANAGAAAASPYWLSPDALACTVGDTQRCAASLVPVSSRDTVAAGALVMMHTIREPVWGTTSQRYLSDLVTVLGPERFERFWRSELDADAALRAVAGVSVGVWTHQWAIGLFGEQRVGPALSAVEAFVALALAGLSLALAAWGWARRQVR